MSQYFINAALKGALEGITEFLPISSTGHLILVRDWLPLSDEPGARERLERAFDILVQFPAILAVVVLYRSRLWTSLRSCAAHMEARRFWGGLLLAFLPAAVAGYGLHAWIEAHLEQPLPVALALFLGGLVLVGLEWRAGKERGPISRAEDVGLGQAGAIGVFQSLALLPGTSRSAASIIGGRLVGLSRTAAAEYSFFLALPTMGAACAFKLYKAQAEIDWGRDGVLFLVGGLVSFLTAWVVVAYFIRFLQRHSLAPFGWYRMGLGALVLIFAGGTHG